MHAKSAGLVSLALCALMMNVAASGQSHHEPNKKRDRDPVLAAVPMVDFDEQHAIEQQRAWDQGVWDRGVAEAAWNQGVWDAGVANAAAMAAAADRARAASISSAPVLRSGTGAPHSDAWWWGVAICEQGGRNDPYFGYFSWMDGSAAGMSWEAQVAKSNDLLIRAGREVGPWAASCVAAGYRASPGG